MKEWIIRLTLIAFGFVIVMLALEFGLSKFAPHYLAHRSDTLHESDELIGGKGIPGKEGKFRHGTIEATVRMNSHGFRDRERKYKKGEDVSRIVVLGDSFTEALQVPLEETYPYILEEKLNSENGKRFEVISLAVSGFGTAQEYLALKHYGLKYQPDFVVLAFFAGNDVQNNSLILESKFEGESINDRHKPFFVLNDGRLEKLPFKVRVKEEGERETKGDVNITGRIKRFLTKSFPNIYYSLSDRVEETPWLANLLLNPGAMESKPKKDGIPLFYQVYTEEYTPEWQNAWEVTKRLILKLKKELEINKIGFLVVVIPNEFEFRPDKWDEVLDRHPNMKTLSFDKEKPERIILDFLETNNIDYVLLRPEFEEYSKEAGKDLHFHYGWENHWNVNGHVLAAQLIYKKLKDDNLANIAIKERISNEDN
jgi:GDSL-like Lipase/Acylhydrolase.